MSTAMKSNKRSIGSKIRKFKNKVFKEIQKNCSLKKCKTQVEIFNTLRRISIYLQGISSDLSIDFLDLSGTDMMKKEHDQ